MRSIETIIEHIELSKAEDNYTIAEALTHEALCIHTDDYRLYEELADIYIFRGKLEKASEILAIARELHPESTTGMYLDGYLATAKGEFERAIEILTKANITLPNNAEILRNLGWAHVMEGNLVKGLSLLRRAYNLAPLEPMVINDLSVALIAAGHEAEARAVLATLGPGTSLDTLKNSEI